MMRMQSVVLAGACLFGGACGSDVKISGAAVSTSEMPTGCMSERLDGVLEARMRVGGWNSETCEMSIDENNQAFGAPCVTFNEYIRPVLIEYFVRDQANNNEIVMLAFNLGYTNLEEDQVGDEYHLKLVNDREKSIMLFRRCELEAAEGGTLFKAGDNPTTGLQTAVEWLTGIYESTGGEFDFDTDTCSNLVEMACLDSLFDVQDDSAQRWDCD